MIASRHNVTCKNLELLKEINDNRFLNFWETFFIFKFRKKTDFNLLNVDEEPANPSSLSSLI